MVLSVLSFAQTQTEMNIESYNQYLKVDKELNVVYNQILKKYSSDKVFLKKLKISQNLWVKFRDAEAEAKEAAAEKQNWFMKAIKLLGDIFVPIIPAIVASGFLMGIMNALDFMNSNGFLHISTTSSIYVFATLFIRMKAIDIKTKIVFWNT